MNPGSSYCDCRAQILMGGSLLWTAFTDRFNRMILIWLDCRFCGLIQSPPRQNQHRCLGKPGKRRALNSKTAHI